MSPTKGLPHRYRVRTLNLCSSQVDNSISRLIFFPGFSFSTQYRVWPFNLITFLSKRSHTIYSPGRLCPGREGGRSVAQIPSGNHDPDNG